MGVLRVTPSHFIIWCRYLLYRLGYYFKIELLQKLKTIYQALVTCTKMSSKYFKLPSVISINYVIENKSKFHSILGCICRKKVNPDSILRQLHFVLLLFFIFFIFSISWPYLHFSNLNIDIGLHFRHSSQVSKFSLCSIYKFEPKSKKRISLKRPPLLLLYIIL